MSDRKKELDRDTELRPLRSMLGQPDLEADARLLGEALQQLHDEPAAPMPGPGWAALEESALRMARRRRWRYHLGEAWRGLGTTRFVAFGAAAAVALVIGVFGVRALSSRDSAGPRGGMAQRATGVPATTPAATAPRLDLQAGAAAREVTLGCGAQVQLAEGSADIDQHEPYSPVINLKRGRVSLRVPPMPSSGRLMVTTTDAEVIVHGTRFLVDRHEQEDATVVSVQEGLVEVRPVGGRRSAVFLRAGEQVVVPSSGAYARQLLAQVGELVESGRCDDKAGTLVENFLLTAPAGTDVNAALYLKGNCAAAKGDIAGALSSFEQVATGAGSALRADNALARIAQLRAGTSAEAGAAAWRRYLDRFPQGQHRDSAQRYLREFQNHRNPN